MITNQKPKISNRTAERKSYYPVQLRKKIIQSIDAGLITQQHACEKYGLSTKLLRQWYRWYHKSFLLLHTTPTSPLIHHSDRGIQYCCREYIALLDKPDIQISMAQEVYQNPIAERINGTLKTEFLRPGYPNHQMALAAVERAIWVYNTLRPHRSINMLKPADAHQLSGPLAKRWKKNKWRENAKDQKSAMNQKKFLSLTIS